MILGADNFTTTTTTTTINAKINNSFANSGSNYFGYNFMHIYSLATVIVGSIQESC